MHVRHIATATIVAGLLSSSVAFAQKIDPAFTKARADRNAALRTGDKATFDKYTSEKFIVTDPTGRVENKAERGARVVPPATPPQGQPAPLEDDKVTPLTKDVYALTWHATQGGARMHFMEIWVKEKGTWKAAAVQVSRIAPPAPAGGGEGRRGEGGGGREGGREGGGGGEGRRGGGGGRRGGGEGGGGREGGGRE
jgi:hypothetical protein